MAAARPPREKNVVEACKRVCEKRGAYYVKTQSGAYGGRAGVADLLIFYRGRGVACECKRPGGKLTKLQEAELEKVRRAGAIAIVAESGEDLARAFDRLDRELDSPAV